METDHFTSLQEEFIKELAHKGRSANTLKNYRTDLGHFKRYLLETDPHCKLKDLSKEQIVYYGEHINACYQHANSRRRRIQVLRLFFDFLVAKKVHRENLVRAIPPSPKFLDIPRPTPPEQVELLWNYLLLESRRGEVFNRALYLRNATLFLLVYGGGLKVSNIEGLRWEQLNIGKNPRVLVNPAKRDPYTVPLPPVSAEIFSNYQKTLSSLGQFSTGKLLFHANSQGVISQGLGARGIEVIFKKLAQKLDITLTPKSLRQACIIGWIQCGIAESTIKEWLNLAPSYSMDFYRATLKKYHYQKNLLPKVYKNHYFN